MQACLTAAAFLLVGLFPATACSQDIPREAIGVYLLDTVSFFSKTSSVVLMDINCGLPLKFHEQINASFLTVYDEYPFSYAVNNELTISEYAKTAVESNHRQKVFLVLSCRNSRQRFKIIEQAIQRKSRTFDETKSRYVMVALGLPLHSTAVLTFDVTASTGPSLSESQLLEFLIVWNETSKTFTSSSLVDRRRYCKLLDLYVTLGPKHLTPANVKHLRFGLAFHKHLRVAKTIMITGRNCKVQIILDDPDYPNATIRINFSNQKLKYATTQSEPLVSLVLPMRPLARLPKFQKGLQVANSVFKLTVWIPTFLTAVAASFALYILKEKYSLSLFLMLTGLWTVASWKPRRKSCKILLIIGSWVLLLQIISVSLRGEIVASLHAVPEYAKLEIEECTHHNSIMEAKLSPRTGEVASLSAFHFVTTALPYFLRGGVICQRSRVLRALREKVFPSLPVYEPKLVKSYQEKIYLNLAHLEVFERNVHGIWSRKSIQGTFFDYGGRCCRRFAQLELAQALVQERHLTAPFYYEHVDKELDIYFNRPLSQTYGEEVCVNHHFVNVSELALRGSTPAKKVQTRCAHRSELKSTLTAELRIDEIFFLIRLFIAGTATSFVVLLGELFSVGFFSFDSGLRVKTTWSGPERRAAIRRHNFERCYARTQNLREVRRCCRHL